MSGIYGIIPKYPGKIYNNIGFPISSADIAFQYFHP